MGAILQDIDLAEDVAAQTFLSAWQHLPTLRRPARFDAWLFRIAHHQALNELRKRRPTTPLDDLPELADPDRLSSPTDLLDGKIDRETLWHALLRLPEMQREVLVLRFLEELPHARIAAQLGKSEEAVRALQYRALNRLRELINR